VTNQYEPLKEAVRVPPLSEIRKACTQIIKRRSEEETGGGGEEAILLLQDKYKTFIGALEKMDSTAGLGMRGRQLPPTELRGLWSDAVQSLQDFLDAAAPPPTAAVVPAE